MTACGIGVMKQNGSPFSKPTVPARVKRQFIVKGKSSQSVSTTPSSGARLRLAVLGAPRTQSAQPGLVRKR